MNANPEPVVENLELLASATNLKLGSRRLGAWRWVARRLLLAVVTLLVLSILVFLLTHVLPGDPAKAIIGRFATPQAVAEVDRELGLDRSLVAQYLSWLGGALHGNLGISYASRQPVGGIILGRLENSATLLALVMVIALPLSVWLGVLGARHRDSRYDNTVLLGSVVLSALPEFVIGILLVTLFATSVFKLLPAVDVFTAGENPITNPTGLVLPVATLVLAVVPYLTRLCRGSMLEALDTSYVETARLRGVPERVVLTRHALRNALVPAIQGTGLTLMYLLGNVVVVEYLYGYPGLGSELASAVSIRDLPLIQGLTMTFAVLFVLFNVVADLATVLVTPRLRTEL